MPQSSQLHRWLQQEESAGTLESQGHFTLEQSKAWEKLGAFQLPFAEAWVLKLVQAAMACPDRHLSIIQSREETSFHFHGTYNWSRERIEDAVFSATQVQDEMGHLAIAIRALAQQKKRPFSVRDSEGAVWAWTGQNFTVLEPEEAESQVSVTVANYEFGKSKSLFSMSNFGASKFRASITQVLAEHCHFSSQRVTMDKRALDGYEGDSSFGLTEHSQPLYLFKTPQLPDCPPLSIPGRVEEGSIKLGDHKIAVPHDVKVLQSHQNLAGAYAILSLFFHRESARKSLKLDRVACRPGYRDSEIIWLNDGVVVKRELLGHRGALGLGVVISAKGLPTDLTAMAPLQNEEKQARIQGSLSKLLALLKDFQQELGPEGLRVSREKRFSTLTGVAGTILLFAVPVLGIAILSKVGIEYHNSKSTRDSLNEIYDKSLNELITFVEKTSLS